MSQDVDTGSLAEWNKKVTESKRVKLHLGPGFRSWGFLGVQ